MQTVLPSLEQLPNQSTYSLNEMSYMGDAMVERLDEFIQLRHDIHKFPELAFDEHRTSELVAGKLLNWGYKVHRGLGRTGVVATLKRGNSTKTVGIRADMDALPIQEETKLNWQSERPGVMHGCGHDGHTATLLAAAKIIAETVEFDGTLNLIFQPAEEGGGGALKMMEDGLFDLFPCDSIFAMHNMPGVPVGHFVFRHGSMMASSDYATIKLLGKGGHGAMPHLAQDPVVAAASIIMALQTVVARNVDPQQTAVVTVGAVHSGQAINVIPASATLELSIRALDPKVRQLLEVRIKSLITAQAQSYGLSVEIDWRAGYTVLVNNALETDLATGVALSLYGNERVHLQGPALTASEDFSFMLEKIPGCYFLIGNTDVDSNGVVCTDSTSSCMVHNPGYDFNDKIISIGSQYWAQLVGEYLKK
jgi:hippurate hydrolase